MFPALFGDEIWIPILLLFGVFAIHILVCSMKIAWLFMQICKWARQ
jgi:hypothetical protein